MDADTIRNLQDRTAAKLRYADIYIREIDKLAGQRGTDADRAHQESFLYHLVLQRLSLTPMSPGQLGLATFAMAFLRNAVSLLPPC
jgi:hypothetical protein